MKSFIVSGTDTGIGKTLLCSVLMAGMPEYSYWKPVQSGLEDGLDSTTVRTRSGCAAERILPETYLLSQPLSPHAAAAIDGVRIEREKLHLPNPSPLLIEGAGGLMVPLNEETLYIDMFKAWNLPVLLACRSALGTINHSLLSIEALRARDIPILGCVLIGERNISNEQAIEYYGNVPVIGHIPILTSFVSAALQQVFQMQLLTVTEIPILR